MNIAVTLSPWGCSAGVYFCNVLSTGQLPFQTLQRRVRTLVLLLSSTLSIFFVTRSLSLKPLWNGSFTFLTSSIICDVEKVFAKKPGFLPDKENRVLNFG
jgi:hypothetical protein